MLNKKFKRHRDEIIHLELKRRKALRLKIEKAEKEQMKVHKKWMKKHKKEYIKNLKKRNKKLYIRYKITKLKLPFILDFLRWIIIDRLRGKQKPLWGVYIFVANPGEGKTISMVKHIEEKKADDSSLKVYTNFNFKGENGQIKCWQDIVRADKNSIIAIDEAHLTFESTDFKNFPPEILAQLSLNRKLRKQFICSTQRYERINKNFRDLANYVVLCKNHLKLDRWFSRYYFDKKSYDAQFDGAKAKAEFIKPYIASDDLYNKYDTLQLVDKLVEDIDEIDIKEHDLIPLIDNILEFHNNLQTREITYISNIRNRLINDVQEHQKELELKCLMTKIDEVDSNLKSELQKLIS